MIGRDFAEAMRILWPEPVAAEIIGHFRHTLETGEPYYSPRFINPRHDVEIVEAYEWELHRMTLPDGQYGVICYYFDSTKLRKAEAALRESEEQFRVLTQNLQSAVALIDERGAFSIVNSSFLRMFDIPQDADILNVNSRDWAQWQVFDERGLLLDVDEHPVRKAALTRTAVRNQLVAVKSPSSPDLKWLLVSAEPILDAQGEAAPAHLHVLRHHRPQGGRGGPAGRARRSTATCSRTSKRWSRVYEVERDDNGQIVERRLRDANRAFLRAVGVSSIDKIRGRTSSQIFGKVWSEAHLPAVRKAMDTGQVQVQEVYRPESGRHYITSVIRLDGGPIWAPAGTSPSASRPRRRCAKRRPVPRGCREHVGGSDALRPAGQLDLPEPGLPADPRL